MDKKTLGEKVLATIKDKKIHRKARWKFLLRDYMIWFFGFISLLLGSLALSVMIYMMRQNGWEDYSYVNDSFLRFVVITLPYFWILFLGFFIFISDYYIKNTKKGYKYRLSLVILGSVLINVFLGVLFYKIGVGEAVDDVLSERAPFYSEFINPNMRLWNQPELGLLSGKINKVSSQYEFELKDIDSKDWVVFHDNYMAMPVASIEKGLRVNLVGEMISTDSFRAEIIKPMGAGRGFLNRGMNEIKNEFKENPKLFNERIELMPRVLKIHPEMEEIFQDHLRRHQQELENFLQERPDLSSDFDGFIINIEDGQ